MFTRLLVGLDGSPGAEAALAAAIDLGRRFHSTILLASLGGGRAGRQGRDGAALVAAAGLTCEQIQASGDMDEQLIDLSEKAEAVVVGRQTLGSVTARVVSRSPRPVLVAGERPSAFARPVVAFDGGSTSTAALTLAARYAEATHVPLDVVTVSDDDAEGDALLARAAAYLSGEQVTHATHRLEGAVAPAVAAHIRGTGADLLVAGAHGERKKRSSWSIGSQAERLIRETEIPVIVQR